MRVRDIMSTPVASVPGLTSIRVAAKQMAAAGTGSLLVDDAGELRGIVTDRDLMVRALAEGVDPEDPVARVMTPTVITVGADADVATAYQILGNHSVRRLPVLDHGQLVGMLSVDDLVVVLSRELAALSRPIRDELSTPDTQE